MTRPLLSIISHHWSGKLISLLLAVTAWFYIASSQARLIDFPGGINLKTRNTPTGLAAVTDIDKIKLKIISNTWQWRQLTADSFEAYVDLSGLSPGIYEKEIIVNPLTSGVKVSEKNPDKILVKLEPVMKKTVPVEVKISGLPAEGTEQESVATEPESIEISGAKSILEKIEKAEARVKLSGQDKDFSQLTAARAYNQGEPLTNLSYAPTEVKVNIAISQLERLKQIGVNPKITGQPAAGYQVNSIVVEPALIEVKGRPEQLVKISNIATEPVDINNVNSDLTVTKKLILPEGTDVNLGTTQVTVKITVGKIML